MQSRKGLKKQARFSHARLVRSIAAIAFLKKKSKAINAFPSHLGSGLSFHSWETALDSRLAINAQQAPRFDFRISFPEQQKNPFSQLWICQDAPLEVLSGR